MKLDKAPSGLLGAFGLKSEGRNPGEFADTVVPTADVFDMYMAPVTGSRGVTGTANVQNSGDSITLTVPQGEMWRLWSVSGGVVIPAATANPDGVGVASLINANYVHQHFLRPPTPTVGVFRASSGIMCPRPYLLPPGDTVQFILQTTLGAAVPGFVVAIRDAFPLS